jgi:tetratricopeptide (TPR) repeat protein
MAASSFARVNDYRPSSGMDFQSKLKTGMMKTAAGQYDAALEHLKDMKRELLTADERGLVELEIGNTYNAMGDTLTAFGVYRFIDTAYRRSDASAKANFQRGLYFERTLGDYKTALAFYDVARGENNASVVTPIAQRKSDYIAKYFALHDNVVRFDTLLYSVLHPDTNAARKRAADSLARKTAAAQEDTARLANARVQADSLAARRPAEKVQPPPQTPPKAPAEQATNAPSPADESQDDNEIPYHRRGMGLLVGMFNENAVPQGDRRSRGGKEGAMGRQMTTAAARDPRIAALKARKVALDQDSLRAAIAESQFEIAGLFMLEMKLMDSSQIYYRAVLDSFPVSPLVPRILYALAEIHRAKNDTVVVDSLYKILLDKYPGTEYGIQVKRFLGMAVDTTARDSAETHYEEASKALLAKKDTTALTMLTAIVRDYPRSPFAPKAQYAMGWIYENHLSNNDSAASVYKKLIALYPSSLYASVAQPKVAVKDDPKSLSKFINIKEILAVQKTEAPRKAAAAEKEKEVKHGRVKNQGVEEDTTDDTTDDQSDDTTDDTKDDTTTDDNNDN